MTTPKTTLPRPGETTLPFWRTELHEMDSFRSSETLPAEVDVAIIGAGFSGTAAAYHLFHDEEQLRRHGPPGSVLMLEARGACSGATGRNGGQLKAYTYYNVVQLAQTHGAAAAAAFAQFERDNVTAVKALVEREQLDCDLVLTRSLDVYLDAAHAAAIAADFAELQRLGLADLDDVQLLTGAAAEGMSQVHGAQAAVSLTAGHVWPYKLVTQLLAKLVRRCGLLLHTHTPVTALADAPDAVDGRWSLTTPRGTVRARQVLLASNGYTAALAPQFHARIVPVRGICSHIAAPAHERARTRPLHMTYSLRHGPGLYDYMIPRLDGSLVLGGAKSRYWHDRSQWYGNTDDTTLIEPPAAPAYFDGYMQRHFVGWEASEAATDYVWSGIMGWTADFMPYVGPVPDKPGQFICAGFNGHGMPQVLLSAKGAAAMMRGQSFAESGLPVLFEPTRARLESDKNRMLE